MNKDTQYKGLSAEQVKELRAKYGFNEIVEQNTSILWNFIKKFLNPITLMIELALVLSIIAGKFEDFFIILTLLIVNIGVEMWQEGKAKNALKALKENLSPQAVVLRDGAFITIPAKELVPGDIIKVTIGDVLPADVKSVRGGEAQLDQATITGESLPTTKHEGEIMYASSIVQKGSFIAEVIDIGQNTFIGKSASLVSKASQEEESHFQKAIIGIGKFLSIVAIIVITILIAFMLYRGDSLIEVIRFSLVLAIASIPVALPAVLSVTMAILGKYKAIVSNFKAVEELAGVDILCIDKTGTVTKNEITVSDPVTYGAFTQEDLFVFASLASEQAHKNKIELAIESYGKDHMLLDGISNYIRKKFTSFTPTTKSTSVVLVNSAGKEFTITMGAPQMMTKELANKEEQTQLIADVAKIAEDGFRALAVIKIMEKGNVQLVGMMPMFDPPRDDSKEVMQAVKKYGLGIKMITGDNTAIARFIGKVLGMGSRIADTKELKESKDVLDLIHNTDIFTEVVPEDKYNIIAELQKEGHIVAMTGDGVNDAPALKKADIGLAVAGASPAARAAADVVLLDPGLKTIKVAIEHARMTFARMQSYATFRIAETIRVIFFIAFSVFIFGFTPITAVMIVLLALLNDIPVMAIAYDNAIVSDEPVRWNLRETITVSVVLGMMGLMSSFFLLWVLNISGVAMAVIYTVVFLKLDVSGHSTLYTTRTGSRHFWQRPFPSLKFFIPAFSSRIIGTLLAFFGIFMEPVSLTVIGIIWVYSTFWFLLNDQVKVFTYKVLRKRK